MSKNKKKKKKVTNKKIDKRNKIFLCVVFGILSIFLLFSLYTIRLEISRKNLEKEFNKLLEVNLTTGDYNKNLECIGKYRKVEKALKDYFITYSDSVKEVIKEVNSEEFTSLLSVETYKNGNADMEKLVNYAIDTKEDLDTKLSTIEAMSTEEYMNTYAENKIKSEEERELFLDYMTSDKAKEYFKKNNDSIVNKQKEIDNILSVSRDLFYFLIINKDNWIIKDNKIQFSNTTLMNQYNEYINNLKIGS